MSINNGSRSAAARPGSWRRDILLNWKIYLIALPIIAYFIIFHYLPMFGIVMAFQDFSPIKGFLGSEWVGIDNFIKFFTGPSFLLILRNTLVISLLGLVIGFPASILFAILLNELNQLFFKKTIQTISYMPYFVSMVVIAGLIIDFCSSNGIITNLLVNLGMKRQNLLQNPSYFWTINLISDLWQGLGYGSIIFIAAITNVSQELHEAATIDGAGRIKRVIHVTIPGMLPVIVTMLILQVGMLMSVGFDKILLLYNPTIYSTADVISTHVQRMGIVNMQYGYSSAVGLFNSVVGTALLLITNALSRKYAEHSVF
ncbi:MAG TPA: sugar ABC transporter permease [Clostridiales bacterium]|nr:sugar ABC transporter permease [Clostridiales bacterium]